MLQFVLCWCHIPLKHFHHQEHGRNQFQAQGHPYKKKRMKDHDVENATSVCKNFIH